MKPLPGDDVVEHKAFELAVRDSDYRMTRIEELRKRMRSSFRMIWLGVFVGLLFLFLKYREPVAVKHFFASFAVLSMILSAQIVIVRSRNEARILQMLEIQEQIAESRTSAL